MTPDGSKVYAAAFLSGNRTTSLLAGSVPDGCEAQGGLPEPNTNYDGIPQPEVGLIVRFNGTHWVDELGRPWDTKVRFSLPDKDVFVIDATANPPVQFAGSAGFYSGVGTVLFNMITNPVSGKVYVSNTEALKRTASKDLGALLASRCAGTSPRAVSPCWTAQTCSPVP